MPWVKALARSHRQISLFVALSASFGGLLASSKLPASSSPLPQDAVSLRWDSFDSRVWTIGIERPQDFAFVVREWVADEGRQVFHIKYTPQLTARSRFLLAFTNLLAPQSVSDVSEIRFEMKWDRRPAQAALKVEGKRLDHPFTSAEESNLFESRPPLKMGGYQEYRIAVVAPGDLSRFVFVFDNLIGTDSNGLPAISDIYLDNLRFVRNGQESVWDTFDNTSRFWVPLGSWLSWAGPTANPALEMIGDFGGFPGGHSGALYLRWDATNGRGDELAENAEIKTEGNTLAAIDAGQPPPGLSQDFSVFDRISADVVCTNQNTLAVFFGHFVDGTATIDRGFITPGVRVLEPGQPQRIDWNIPWPPGFPADDVDVVGFVVRDVKNPGLGTGELRIDNVVLSRTTFPSPDSQHSVWNINHFDGVDTGTGFLGGNFGEFSPRNDLTSDAIRVTTDYGVSANTDERRGASLRFDIDLSQVDFAGEFVSLFGHTDFPEYTLDLTEFSQIQFKLKAGTSNTEPLRLRIEVKDNRDSNDHTAFRYITVPPFQEQWQSVILDADITNPNNWFFNRFPPDPKRAKLLIIVAERSFNPQSFAFDLDEIRLIHRTEEPFSIARRAIGGHPDGMDPLLEHIERKAWLHFDRWVIDGSSSGGTGSQRDLYLFLDRSTFPDLASTAAAGFGLGAICAAHHNKWISDEAATSRVLRVLRTYANGMMATDPTESNVSDGIGLRGWFWHLLDQQGARKTRDLAGRELPDLDKSELSTVDTAIFLWGALAAKAYFNSTDRTINPAGPGPRAAEIASLADALYSRVDFRFFLRAEMPKANQIYLAWKPERVSDPRGRYEIRAPGLAEDSGGFFSGSPEAAGTWDYYTDEALMILLLGVNSPNPSFRLPMDVLDSFERVEGSFTSRTSERVGPLLQSFFGSAFTYFFQQCFLRLDGRFESDLGRDFLENARLAARANWLYCRDRAGEGVPTFLGNVFGLTAAEGRDRSYHGEWGSPPRAGDLPTDDGTIAAYGPASFIAIWPDDFRDAERVTHRNPSVDALATLFREGRIFDESIGFGDALNLIPDQNGVPFYNMTTFGIDNGPLIMMIENERSGLFWNLALFAPAPPDFALVVDPPAVNAQRGTTIRVTVNIVRRAGFAGRITLLPPDASTIGVKVKPRGPIVAADVSSAFKLKVKGGALAGSHDLIFAGQDESGRVRSAGIRVTIE